MLHGPEASCGGDRWGMEKPTEQDMAREAGRGRVKIG